MTIRPIPQHVGRGVFDFVEHPEYADRGYRVEHAGRYWNYHFTPKGWRWPEPAHNDHPYVIDGFSPNLNKDLHIGHLRNLMVASALSHLLPKARMVGMLGAAVGVDEGALDRLQAWYDRAGYSAQVFLDTDLPDAVETVNGVGEQAGCKVWNGPRGPVIVRRADGRTTYAHHDLSFAKLVSPTHYVTGAEQREHFESLGFGEKHLPMGLVLGTDGKKISSRVGGTLSGREALDLVTQRLDKTPEPDTLAWSVMAWNFLRVSRAKNVLFEPEAWTTPDTPGMYINYTLARLDSALGDLEGDASQVTDADIPLLGFTSYLDHFVDRAVELMDPAPVANYLHDLAIQVTSVYHAEKIKDGRPGLQFVMRQAHGTMVRATELLGLQPLTRI